MAPGEGGLTLIRLPCDTLPPVADRVLTASNGTRVEWVQADQPIEIPPLAPQFVLTRAGEIPGAGRAGML